MSPVSTPKAPSHKHDIEELKTLAANRFVKLQQESIMSSSSAPPWDAQALLSGLPVTNWKKRTGYEMRGTLAACVERWLSLPDYQKVDCTLRADGVPLLDGKEIAGFVEQNGLPPVMAARLQRTAAEYLKLIEEKTYEPPPSADKLGPGHSTPRSGGSRG